MRLTREQYEAIAQYYQNKRDGFRGVKMFYKDKMYNWFVYQPRGDYRGVFVGEPVTPWIKKKYFIIDGSEFNIIEKINKYLDT